MRVTFLPRLASLACASALVTGCGAATNGTAAMTAPVPAARAPHNSRTVYVDVVNKIDAKVTVRVLHSYPFNPIWVLEKSECVAPGGDMKVKVVYSFGGAQLRIQALEDRCGGLPSSRQATVDFKSIKFHSFEARFRASTERQDGTRELCAAQGSSGQTCARFQ
jgi:hypothetical protein